MQQLIECVPNFSEGIDLSIITQITNEIEKIDGVRLLNVDPGKATNRTVVTFVGTPQAVIDAAFVAIKKAGELIDMSKHKGEHPRMGATDVCPLIPIANISMEETAKWAVKLRMVSMLFSKESTSCERARLTTVSTNVVQSKASKR